ncbi:MAG: molybdopterin-guanine dinucleotide biosynthesis protein B [Oscillospiraceae bacterium]|nr:molybdopterin-guanine dinucleotide biosynthesis protein B [Oscillospiraceae bacterium]
MENIPIFSIVAFSGTGKTTLLEKLITELKSRGMRVAVVKHDAHEFDIDHIGKDSWRFTQAGADISAIISGSKAAIMENRPMSIDALLGKISDVDIILAEGYKSGDWPKIAVQRAATGKPLPVPAEECLAIVTDVLLDGEFPQSVPRFGLDDVIGLVDLILDAPRYARQHLTD